MKRYFCVLLSLFLINNIVCSQSLFNYSYYEKCELMELDINNSPLKLNTTSVSFPEHYTNPGYAVGILLKNDSLIVELDVQNRKPDDSQKMTDEGAEFFMVIQIVFKLSDSNLIIQKDKNWEPNFFEFMLEDDDYVSSSGLIAFAISDKETALYIDSYNKSIVLYVFDNFKIMLKPINPESNEYSSIKRNNDSNKIKTYSFPSDWEETTSNLSSRLQSESIKYKSKEIITGIPNNNNESQFASYIFDDYYQQGEWTIFDAMAYNLIGHVKRCKYVNCIGDINFGCVNDELNFRKNGSVESLQKKSYDRFCKIIQLGKRKIIYNKNKGLIDSVTIEELFDAFNSLLTSMMVNDSLTYHYNGNVEHVIINKSKRSLLIGNKNQTITYKISNVKLDSQGNWIERTVNDGEKETVEKRIITYYEKPLPKTAKEYYKRGCQFLNGQGELINYEKADSYFKKAEELGYINENIIGMFKNRQQPDALKQKIQEGVKEGIKDSSPSFGLG